jgi:hypothetical protein
MNQADQQMEQPDTLQHQQDNEDNQPGNLTPQIIYEDNDVLVSHQNSAQHQKVRS